jgi:hypothetical protein
MRGGFAMRTSGFVFGVGLCVLGVVGRIWIAPMLTRLPADYADEASFDTWTRFRDSPRGAWQRSRLTARRVDQTLVSSGTHCVIQGDLHWTNADGSVAYESTGLYGVDRRTRKNLAGFGNMRRTDQFFFPLHTERRAYRQWDPHFIGPRDAVFKRAGERFGVDVYVFDFTARGLDESAGFGTLPDVPERYLALTNAKGTVWIEPVSGMVVDYAEQGESYFADPRTHAHVADFYAWHDRLTPASRAAKTRAAIAGRRRVLLIEIVAPLLCVLGGVALMIMSWRARLRAVEARTVVVAGGGA